MISEAIDFRFLLLENYKKLKISENQLAVIFMIDHLTSQGNPFVTGDILSLKLGDKLLKVKITYTMQGKREIPCYEEIKENDA